MFSLITFRFCEHERYHGWDKLYMHSFRNDGINLLKTLLIKIFSLVHLSFQQIIISLVFGVKKIPIHEF